jgi:hypothetical protein
MEAMKDSCGFGIVEGLYEDNLTFNYYHIKKTPEGWMKKEANEKEYSPLDFFTASNIRRMVHQKELAGLVLSVELEKKLCKQTSESVSSLHH